MHSKRQRVVQSGHDGASSSWTVGDIHLTGVTRVAMYELDPAALFDAVNSMEEAVVAYDAEGRLLVCNAAFLAMYGYTREQARPGVHFRELGELDIRQGNVAVEDEQGEDYLARKAHYRSELDGSFTVKLHDGRWIRTTDRRMGNGGFVSVHVDVTDLKLAQAQMREAQLEARRHQRELARLNRELERQVAARTRQLEAARELAERRARTDSLTGLSNRGAFLEQAKIVHERARRYGREYTLMMLDIDHFKRINDTFGHLAGDAALAHLGNLLRSTIRKADVAGRIGGEEFVSVLPEVSAANTSDLAERLRLAIAAMRIPVSGNTLSMTVSIGIADVAEHDNDVKDVMARADAALYEAKEQGRNRIVLAAPAFVRP